MPTYDVTLRINVPTVGDRFVLVPSVVASSLTEAMTTAKTMVIVAPTKVEKTAL